MKMNTINQLLKTCVDREVWVVTAAHGGQRAGLLATFVSPISIVPELPRLAIALSKLHHTWSVVEAAGTFAVHLLKAEQAELAWRFGTQSGRNMDKFDGLPCRPGVTGSPILSAAQGWLECRVEASFDTGDRTLYLAEVVAGDLTASFSPLTQVQLIKLASTEQLEALRSQLASDAAQDAVAIQHWRMSEHVRRNRDYSPRGLG